MTRRWRQFVLLVLITVLLLFMYLSLTCDTNRHYYGKSETIIKRRLLDKPALVGNHSSPSLRVLRSYLLSLYTLEQLTMSSAHFYSLVNLAHAWNLTAVEPVVCNSRIFGLRKLSGCKSKADIDVRTQIIEHNTRAESTELGFGQLFNLTYLQHNLSRCLSSINVSNNASQNSVSKPLFVDSLANFLKHSYRDIVLVHFVHMPGSIAGKTFISYETLKGIDKELLLSAHKRSVFDCSNEATKTGLAQKVEDKLNLNLFLSPIDTAVETFRVAHVICVDFKNLNMSLNELEEVIISTRRKVTGRELELEATIVFTKWQVFGPLKEPKNFHIFNSCNGRWSIPYSEEISLTSKQFLSFLKITKPFLSVHMRLERLYQCEVHTQGYLGCCLQRFTRLMRSLSLKYGIHPANLVMVKDYGTYGSDSCIYKNISICLSTTKSIEEQLKHWGYSFTEFDPKNIPGAPRSSGFVSLVEAHTLLSGEALVTLGFGSFQSSIIRNFAQSTLDVDAQLGIHKILSVSDHIYRICPCTLLRGQTEKLNGLELGASCEADAPPYDAHVYM